MNDPVLLVILAHPDDETFGIGGTLALYARRGVSVHLICATRGEAGTMDPDCLEGFDSVAARRVSELRCAAGILGLSGVHFLDYRDSGMQGAPENKHPQALARAPLDEVAGSIVSYIRRLRPQVIVTHDPIGGYKHPDHIAVNQATAKAFHLASDPAYIDPEKLPPYQPLKLYYHIFSRRLLRVAVRIMPLIGRNPHKFGRNGDVDLAELVQDAEFPIHAVIDYRSVRKERDAAAACHESQLGGGPPRGGILGWVWTILGNRDTFMRAYPEMNGHPREHDLFQGISD